MLGKRDDMALLAQPRLPPPAAARAEPRPLDRCAAFDDAVVQLQDRDPLRDQGPFSELAVTGRQWSAASTLSNDYLAIDGRLDRIRLRVELALAPPEPPRRSRRTAESWSIRRMAGQHMAVRKPEAHQSD